MFVEVFPIEVARAIQPSKLEAPRPQMYEVRFIILETFNIPKIPPKVDINLINNFIEKYKYISKSIDGCISNW